MFCGAYWSARAEDRDGAAGRVLVLLKALRESHKVFEVWFLTPSKKGAAGHPLELSIEGIAKHLETNRRDIGGAIMPELGFRIMLWNPAGASLSCTIGVTNGYVKNAVALSYNGSEPVDESTWKNVLQAVVTSMDPDEAGVATEEALARDTTASPASVGWQTYKRGQSPLN
jgi:hypothetical protein